MAQQDQQHQFKVELSEAELEYLRKIHNATALREMMKHPGWDIMQKAVQEMFARLENQHLNFAAHPSNIPTKEAYWASGMRLAGAREFAQVLLDRLAQEVGLLGQGLRIPPPLDPTDFDGEIGTSAEEA